MKTIDNGGASAIKGFNYQKSIAMLIAVLYFLEKDFELAVEAEDDIVFSSSFRTVYIQAKSATMSLATVSKKHKGKPSVIEKNMSHGTGKNDLYKIVSPAFKNIDKTLKKVDATLITQGASIFQYSSEAIKTISKNSPNIPQEKLARARVALTNFKDDQSEFLIYIQGIMASKGIPVDNNHGQRSLEELSGQIDQRSSLIAKSEDDYEKKKFTPKDLSNIFSHSHKLEIFKNIIQKLNYSIPKQEALIEKRVSIAALYGAVYADIEKAIKKLDIIEINEVEVVSSLLENSDFKNIEDTLIREAIVIDAYSQVIYEKEYI